MTLYPASLFRICHFEEDAKLSQSIIENKYVVEMSVCMADTLLFVDSFYQNISINAQIGQIARIDIIVTLTLQSL